MLEYTASTTNETDVITVIPTDENATVEVWLNWNVDPIQPDIPPFDPGEDPPPACDYTVAWWNDEENTVHIVVKNGDAETTYVLLVMANY